MSQKLIIFTDIGDTIIDEGTEVREVPNGIVYRADCIPGARETMLTLYEQGYTIAMVADGLVESFHNTMTQNGLEHIFAAKAISEELGVQKPNALMFQTAMDRLGLTDLDKKRIVMIGNNVERDVAGARRFGIRSIQLVWSNRHPSVARCDDERADYQIHDPRQLLTLIEELNAQLP